MENNYKEYLDSFAWKAIKQVKLSEQPECECCGESATTVHHLSYERRGSEREDDIVSICERCHNECHFVNGYQIKNDEETLRKRFEEVKGIYGGNSKFSIEGEDIFYDGEKMENIGKYYFYDEKIYFYRKEYYDYPDYSGYVNYDNEEYNNNIENDGNRYPVFDGYGAFERGFKNKDEDEEIDKKEFIGMKKVYSKEDNDGTDIVYELNIDFSTFKIIDDEYIKDKNFVYCNHKKLKGVDSETFEKVEGSDYYKDKNFVYDINFKKIKCEDPYTFENIDDSYYKDKKFVYSTTFGRKLEGADSESFEKIEDSYYYKDKNFIYFRGEKLKEVDVNTFRKYSKFHYKDKNHNYDEKGNILT